MSLQLVTACIIAAPETEGPNMTTAASGESSGDSRPDDDEGDSGGRDGGGADPGAADSTSAAPDDGADAADDSRDADDASDADDAPSDGECVYWDDVCADRGLPQTDCGEPMTCPTVSILASDEKFAAEIEDRAAADCVLTSLRDDTPGYHNITYTFDDGSDIAVTLQTMGNGSVITHLAESSDGDCLDVFEAWEPLRSVGFFDDCLFLDDADLADSGCLVEPGAAELCSDLDVPLSCR